MVQAIVVVRSFHTAWEWARRLDKPLRSHDFWLVGPGDALSGVRADNIMISQEVLDTLIDPQGDSDSEGRWAWLRESLLCRLKPGGRLIVIEPEEAMSQLNAASASASATAA